MIHHGTISGAAISRLRRAVNILAIYSLFCITNVGVGGACKCFCNVNDSFVVVKMCIYLNACVYYNICTTVVSTTTMDT